MGFHAEKKVSVYWESPKVLKKMVLIPRLQE
jgi:hypothetical protein